MNNSDEVQPGPPLCQNWHACNLGLPASGVFEYPVYTDADLHGEIDRPDWPFALINAVPRFRQPGLVQPAVILRLTNHMVMSRPSYGATYAAGYHGGDISEEIAALASLCLGVRMRAGNESRFFLNALREPFGRPVAADQRGIPQHAYLRRELKIPTATFSANLSEAHRLSTLVNLSGLEGSALVQAARLYQEALWVAESQPSQAWLLLVSALEVAANKWKKDGGSSIEKLEAQMPYLVQMLRDRGDEGLAEDVADILQKFTGVTKKFVDFTIAHLPAPPSIRPNHKRNQIRWTKKGMSDLLSTIYGYRSDALHGGIPFPAPMCAAAFCFEGDVAPVEIGTTALSESSHGGTWLAKDLPLSLNTFHFVVRGTLLKWWESLGSESYRLRGQELALRRLLTVDWPALPTSPQELADRLHAVYQNQEIEKILADQLFSSNLCSVVGDSIRFRSTRAY